MSNRIIALSFALALAGALTVGCAGDSASVARVSVGRIGSCATRTNPGQVRAARLHCARRRICAIIKSIVVRNPNYLPFSTSSQEPGQACWRDDVRVPPGGRLDTFYTDDGAAWLSYCYVGIGTTGETNLLEVEVQFVDDQGNAGSVSTTVTRFRALDYPRLM